MVSRCFLGAAVALLVMPVVAQQPQGNPSVQVQPAPGQAGQGQPRRRPPAQAPTLKGEDRARYILRQLDLTPEQRKQGEGLIEVHYRLNAKNVDLVELQSLLEEGKAAQAAGDKAREAEINERLRQIGDPNGPETAFLSEFEPTLNDAQRQKLKDVLTQLAANPAAEFRPIDLFDFLRGLPLDDKQKAEYVKLTESIHLDTATRGIMSDDNKYAIITTAIANAKKFISAEQAAQLDKLAADRLATMKKKAEEAAKAAASAPAAPTLPAGHP